MSEASPASDRVVTIRGEIVSLLEDKLQELHTESMRIHTLMEQVLFRIGNQGFGLQLEDFSTAEWNRVATEVKALQEALEVVECHD